MKDQEVSRIEVLKKKNKKRLSIDERQRVIRFTTGEPYLEYLPNMLSKDKVKFYLFRRKNHNNLMQRKNLSSTAAWPTAARSRRIRKR